MLFCSDTGKHILASYPDWAMDGTFSTAPDLFTQVYFVGAHVSNGQFIPCGFCLLNKKTKVMYMKLLETLKGLVGKSPERIMVDFEASAHEAVREVFPDTIMDIHIMYIHHYVVYGPFLFFGTRNVRGTKCPGYEMSRHEISRHEMSGHEMSGHEMSAHPEK